MKVDAFDFEMPSDAIAQHPSKPRDAARMLEVGPHFLDCTIRDLPDQLRPGDILVTNDTRVIPARLIGKRGAAKIEVTLHKCETPVIWRAFARPTRRLSIGEHIQFADNFAAEVAGKGDAGEVTLHFKLPESELMAAIQRHGATPLPPYIKRQTLSDNRDADDYQTIFANRPGAVAAPTAGLHFTPPLLAAIEARGIRRATVTLHVGAGTFLPVKAEHLVDHVMHSEWGEISAATAAAINAARDAGGRIVSVGTTSLRLLESATDDNRRVHPFSADTNIYITPGYRFKAVDLLLTNFHLPRSTLFMLVSAFSGLERMKRAYAHALARGYRFYSYGDACLLHPGEDG
jgi:S-adenosylmethionine:tRNA ribosyltransferase-isomerase